MAVEMSAKITVKHNMTKRQLVEELERINIPDEARLSVHHYKGDQRDPSYTYLTWSWQQ